MFIEWVEFDIYIDYHLAAYFDKELIAHRIYIQSQFTNSKRTDIGIEKPGKLNNRRRRTRCQK